MAAFHAGDLFVAGGAKEAAELQDALNNKTPTNMVGELSWYSGCAFKRTFKDGTIIIMFTEAFRKSQMSP